MDRPRPDPGEQGGGPAPGDERGWLERLIELQPLPALVVETDTSRVVAGNEAARRALLWLPAGARPCEDCYAIDPRGSRIEAGHLARYLLDGAAGPDGVEITWHAPGQELSLRVYSRLLRPEDGRAPLSLLSFLDVTGRKSAEAELRQALEARDEFFSVATHELKDPLFSLQLSIQLLRHSAERQGEIPVHVVHHMDVSERQVARLARLIDNLLDVSRIANSRLQLDLEALDLCELVHQVAGRFQGQARSVGTPLASEGCQPIIGYFDRMKLEQVVGNLLSNAIKYGDGNPVTVRVRSEDGTAVVEVEDRGVGIAPEDQARIFERFERASQGHKKASLGLGLYIVRSLVEAHGGVIGVRSEPGKGATFTVELPRNRLPSGEHPTVEATGTDTS